MLITCNNLEGEGLAVEVGVALPVPGHGIAPGTGPI